MRSLVAVLSQLKERLRAIAMELGVEVEPRVEIEVVGRR
jgi:hypothetical protein